MVLAGISKHYDGVAALTDVSLDIRPGEIHALLGENGAGKSTLMGVASGTTVPDAGTITVRGELVERLTRRAWPPNWASPSSTSTRPCSRT